MNQKMAVRMMDLLKKGGKYREGQRNILVELYYEAPFFIRYEYQNNGTQREIYSTRTKMTEREMLNFILGKNGVRNNRK